MEKIEFLDGREKPCPHCQSIAIPGNRRTKGQKVNCWYCLECKKTFYWIEKEI